MPKHTNSPLRLFFLIYSGGLVLATIFLIGLTQYLNIPLWPEAGVIGAFALLGVVLFRVLQHNVAQPLAAMKAYTDNILEGRYDGTDMLADSELNKTVTELATRYKERLGFTRSILAGLPMPTCIVDTDEKVTFLNQECLDMIGSRETPESYHGKMLSQVFYKDDRRSKIAECMENDQRTMNLEAVFKHADGSDINLLANLFPLHDVEGKVIGGCCVYLNTTEIKRHEAEILDQNKRIAKAAQEATMIARDLAEAATHLETVVDQARTGTRSQTRRIDETATAMEEMNATVMEVARHAVEAAEGAEDARSRASEGATIVTEVVSAIHDVADNAEGLRTSMEGLDRKADNIGKVVNVIEDIADQTNLLALNAAIEAARAGEAGRGFAVVADEVRKLAEKTMAATSEVHHAITGIQDGARENVKATEVAVGSVNESTELASSSGKTLNSIVSMAESTADKVRSIATAAEQQSAASEEINRATVDVSQLCADTDELMVDASEAVGRLTELADSLNTVIREME